MQRRTYFVLVHIDIPIKRVVLVLSRKREIGHALAHARHVVLGRVELGKGRGTVPVARLAAVPLKIDLLLPVLIGRGAESL